MVDSVEHLDLIAAAVGDVAAPIRVCLDFDASFWTAGSRVKIGAKRSPIHTPEQARQLAEAIVARPGVTLAGMMSYEGHIAGQGDKIAGARAKSMVIARMQRASYAELRERRAAAVAAVSQVAPLAFVNAGGTGDLERVATEPAMTEATAGSGFYAPTLFDNYSSFRLEPAAMFALPVSRRPGPGIVTALGGGYLASGVGRQGPHAHPLPPGRPQARRDGGHGRGPDPAARQGRRRPAHRRQRLLPPHQGRRAVRALQQPVPGAGRRRSSTRSRPTAARASASCERSAFFLELTHLPSV